MAGLKKLKAKVIVKDPKQLYGRGISADGLKAAKAFNRECRKQLKRAAQRIAEGAPSWPA
jgi:hypothetical protein